MAGTKTMKTRKVKKDLSAKAPGKVKGGRPSTKYPNYNANRTMTRAAAPKVKKDLPAKKSAAIKGGRPASGTRGGYNANRTMVRVPA